jgi:hypothetical protein
VSSFRPPPERHWLNGFAQIARDRAQVTCMWDCVTLWLIGLLLQAGLAHAQPTNWQSYQIGPTTYYSGTDAKGGEWTGSGYEQWGKRFYEFTGSDGQTLRCSAYALPGARNTECWP